MDTFLRWLGPLIGLFGLAAGFIYFKLNKTRKTLDWLPVSHIRLLTPRTPEGISDLLEVSYGGELLTEPRVVNVRIKNTGNKEIKGDEFTTFPTFEFKRCRIVEAACVAESSPGVYSPSLHVFSEDEPSIVTDPELLNSGDWYEMQFVVDGPKEWPTLTARFAGQTKPVRKGGDDARISQVRKLALGAMATGIAIFVTALLAFRSPEKSADLERWQSYVILMGVMFISVSAALFTYLAGKKADRDARGENAL